VTLTIMGGDDWIDLWFSALTPTSLTLLSKELCAPPPFLDDLIDFHKVNHRPPRDPLKRLVVNAYNIDKKSMDWFSTPHLNAAHLRAAFAFPFIYPPLSSARISTTRARRTIRSTPTSPTT
jgi:NTE family protein